MDNNNEPGSLTFEQARKEHDEELEALMELARMVERGEVASD